MDRPAFPDDCHSALCKHLNDEVWTKLAGTQDAAGFQFEDAIASGVANPDSSTGVYAGSADSYRAFSPLFDPIIADYHGDTSHRSDHEAAGVPALSDDTQAAIRSTRMRVARNLAGVPFGPAISRGERQTLEDRVVQVLESMPGDLAGTYLRLGDLSKQEQQQLIDDHLLFKEGDRFLEAAGLTRHWPEARGMFMNADRTVLVWVNEEDHLRIISIQQGGDVHAVWDGLRRTIQHLDEALDFACDDRLGYLSSCPTNLGTGLRASVHIHLPGLSDDEREAMAAAHHVQVRGVHGEHSESEGDVYDISNKRRLGWTEAELLADLVGGIQALVAASSR